jgi:hypothetical protein
MIGLRTDADKRRQSQCTEQTKRITGAGRAQDRRSCTRALPLKLPWRVSPHRGTELPGGEVPDAYGAVEGGLFGLLFCCPPPCCPPPQLPELPAQANEGLSSSGPMSELAELVQLARPSARSAPRGRSVRMVRSPISYWVLRRARRRVLRLNRRPRKAGRVASRSRQLARKRMGASREKIVIVAKATTCGIRQTMTHMERAWLVMVAGPS